MKTRLNLYKDLSKDRTDKSNIDFLLTLRAGNLAAGYSGLLTSSDHALKRMGLLHTSSGKGQVPSSFGGKLFPGSFLTSVLASSMLSSCHSLKKCLYQAIQLGRPDRGAHLGGTGQLGQSHLSSRGQAHAAHFETV